MARLLLAAGVLGAFLTACGRAQVQTVEVSAPTPTTAAAPAAPPGPVETFQGEVARVDPVAGEILLDVQIVWAPVLRADRHQRRVIVDSQTRWEPGLVQIGELHRGDPLQVEGEGGPDGSWRALQIQLFDID